MVVTRQEIEQVLQLAMKSGCDFAELFFEDKEELNISCDGRVTDAISSVRIHGVGLYLLRGSQSIYTYTSDSSFASLCRLAEEAASLSFFAQLQPEKSLALAEKKFASPNPVITFPAGVLVENKIKVLRQAALAAAGAGPSLRRLRADYFDTDQRVWVANSQGLFTSDRRVTSRIRLQAAVEWNGDTQAEWGDYTRAQGFEAFAQEENYTRFAREFVQDIQAEMQAASAPSCVVPVVMEAGACGTFWHEACGHSLEAAAIHSHRSDFAGQLEQPVASPKVTLVDDGTLAGQYGSAAIDDEGHPTQRNVLIENGVLKGYLCDRLGGRQLGLTSSGSGRRQSYTFAPAARMSNTYLAAGEDDNEEMIRSVPEGLFVKRLGGGTGGREFSVAVSEGYWIRNGKLSHRVKGLTLNARGIDAIKKVDRVGPGLETEGGSFCGAASGLCPVTSFQPRMRISEMTIGGQGE